MCPFSLYGANHLFCQMRANATVLCKCFMLAQLRKHTDLKRNYPNWIAQNTKWLVREVGISRPLERELQKH